MCKEHHHLLAQILCKHACLGDDLGNPGRPLHISRQHKRKGTEQPIGPRLRKRLLQTDADADACRMHARTIAHPNM